MSNLSFEEFQMLQFAVSLQRRRPKFFQKAACAESGIDMFFPGQGQSAVMREAKALCHSCPVQYECLSYAIKEKIEHGVWGGSSASERRVWITDELTPDQAWDQLSLTEE